MVYSDCHVSLYFYFGQTWQAVHIKASSQTLSAVKSIYLLTGCGALKLSTELVYK